MAFRSVFAVALACSMAMALATDLPQPENLAVASTCPGMTAHIIFSDYDGTHALQMCVAPQGLGIVGANVNLHLYDNQADGIFHNGFEGAP